MRGCSMFNVRNVRFYILLFVIGGLVGTSGRAFAGSTETLLIGIVSLDEMLANNAPDVVANVAAGSQEQANFRAVLLHDVYTETHSTIYNIANGQISTSIVEKVDVGSAGALAAFVNDVRSDSAAQREILTLIGHGVTPIPNIAWDGTLNQIAPPDEQESENVESPNARPVTPIFWDLAWPHTVSSSERNYDFLNTPEMGDFLNMVTNDGNDPLDILFFDQCFQGSLDALYEVKDAADTFIASPNYAWAAYSYDQFVPAMATGANNADIANEIMSNYQTVLDDEHPNSIFWITSDEIDSLAHYVGQMGVALKYALEENLISAGEIEALQSQFRYVDTGLNTHLDTPDEYVTLHSLATAFNTLDDGLVRYMAQGILTRLETVSSAYISGRPHINPDVEWVFNNNDTITVLAPLGQNSYEPSSIWRSYLYADPTVELRINDDDAYVTGKVMQTLKFTQEHAWDNFIAYWYVDSVDENKRVSEIEIDPFIHAAPNAVSESLFDFEDNTNWSYHYSRIGKSSIVDGAMQINYLDMQLHEMVAFNVELGEQNWNRFDALSIAVEGTNSGNQIQIYVEDRENGLYTSIHQDDFVGWKTLTIPLSNEGLTHQTGQAVDLSELFSIGIEMQTRNASATSGSIRVDDIRLIDGATVDTLFDFDNATHGWNYHYSSVGRTHVIGGVLQIDYKNLSPYQYFAHHSGLVPLPEWGDYQTISFSAKGSNSGNELMLYINGHTVNWAEYILIDDFDDWKEMEIKLSDFSSADGRFPTDIYRIGFQIQNVSADISTGSFQIDNIMINK